MRQVNATGSYTRKTTGEEVSYDFAYDVLEQVTDMSEAELLALVNRMLKVDANNTAREKAKSVNGDSTARMLTPEQKEANKVTRKADRELLAMIKGKGLSEADIKALLA